MNTKYMRLAPAVARRVGTVLPSLSNIEAGRAEFYQHQKGGEEIAVRFPYTSRTVGPAPLNMRHVRMARGRKGWQTIEFSPAEFKRWFNAQAGEVVFPEAVDG